MKTETKGLSDLIKASLTEESVIDFEIWMALVSFISILLLLLKYEASQK